MDRMVFARTGHRSLRTWSLALHATSSMYRGRQRGAAHSREGRQGAKTCRSATTGILPLQGIAAADVDRGMRMGQRTTSGVQSNVVHVEQPEILSRNNRSAAHAAVPDSHVIIGFKASMVVALQKFAAQYRMGLFLCGFYLGRLQEYHKKKQVNCRVNTKRILE